VSSRTIERWLDTDALGFPQPLVINRRRYFRVAELIAWERARAGQPRIKPSAPRRPATQGAPETAA
jgi:hypothetical protein